MKPRLLDLFCGAGGAAMGYARAGFEVVGVDIAPQPHYPFEFHQADAFHALGSGWLGTSCWWPTDFDVIHASPPCQDHSSLRSLSGVHGTAWMLGDVIDVLRGTKASWVVENVARAHMPNSIQLCGSSFGLEVRRHRRFVVAPMIALVPPCAHHLQPLPVDVTGTGGPGGRHRKPRNLEHAREAMGIDWMTRPELSQAVPPAYTEFLGTQLLASLEKAA